MNVFKESGFVNFPCHSLIQSKDCGIGIALNVNFEVVFGLWFFIPSNILQLLRAFKD